MIYRTTSHIFMFISEIFDVDAPLKDPSSYRKLVGKLLYHTITRPNITFIVSHFSQFLSNLQQSHTLILLLKYSNIYIKGALGKGILYRRVIRVVPDQCSDDTSNKCWVRSFAGNNSDTLVTRAFLAGVLSHSNQPNL